jgi:hypothetical protein
MESKFMNLKKEYREFIKKTSAQIKTINIDDNELPKEKCIKILQLYNKIYNELESSSLNINDINHIIKNYNKEDQDVEILKKFIRAKNAYLIGKTLQSEKFKTFILKLKEEIDLGDKKLNKKINEHLLSKAVFRLLKLNVDMFRGCWEIVEFNDDKIKKIDIIDPEHFEFIKKYLNEKIKK